MVNFEPLKPVDPSFFKDPPSEIEVLVVGGDQLYFLQFSCRQIMIFDPLSWRNTPAKTGQPKAHAINPRSLEIFRQYGLDMKELRNLGALYEESQWVRFVTLMTGTSIGELPYERQDEAMKSLIPEPLFNWKI